MRESLQNAVTDDDRRQTTDDDRRRGPFLMQPLDRWSMAAKNKIKLVH